MLGFGKKKYEGAMSPESTHEVKRIRQDIAEQSATLQKYREEIQKINNLPNEENIAQTTRLSSLQEAENACMERVRELDMKLIVALQNTPGKSLSAGLEIIMQDAIVKSIERNEYLQNNPDSEDTEEYKKLTAEYDRLRYDLEELTQLEHKLNG